MPSDEPRPARLIDSHCHLEPRDFVTADGGDERPAVLERARAAGVEAFICVGSGSSLDEVRNAVDEVERLAGSHPRVVAVGETGLDYYYEHSPPAEQQETLRRFIAIARKTRR